MAEMKDEDWCTCSKCKKYYALPLLAIYLRTKENPIRCPQGHIMTYYPNSTTWQRLTGIYYLLDSLYITSPKAVSFEQLEHAGTIIRELKERKQGTQHE